MPTTPDYALLADPPIALATGAYSRFGNLVKSFKWNDLCQCNANPVPATCSGFVMGTGGALLYGGGSSGENGDTWHIDAATECDGAWIYNADSVAHTYVLNLWNATTHALIDSVTTASVPSHANRYTAWPSIHSFAIGDVILCSVETGPGIFTGYVANPCTTTTISPWAHCTGFLFGNPAGVYPTSSAGFTIFVQPDLCTPNSPVIPPDPTPPTAPTGFPTYPGPAACSSFSDVCAAVGQVLSLVQQIEQQVVELQRWRLPFGTRLGTVHSGLSGSGDLVVDPIMGVLVHVTARPIERLLQGNPPYVWNLGWVSLGDDNGMFAEKRVTQDQFYWLPEPGQLATKLSYALSGGVTVSLTEILPQL